MTGCSVQRKLPSPFPWIYISKGFGIWILSFESGGRGGIYLKHPWVLTNAMAWAPGTLSIRMSVIHDGSTHLVLGHPIRALHSVMAGVGFLATYLDPVIRDDLVTGKVLLIFYPGKECTSRGFFPQTPGISQSEVNMLTLLLCRVSDTIHFLTDLPTSSIHKNIWTSKLYFSIWEWKFQLKALQLKCCHVVTVGLCYTEL